MVAVTVTSERVTRLLRPDSIAVVGASERPSPGRTVTENVLRHYGGRVELISRTSESIFGRSTVQSLDRLAEPVDLAVLAISADGALEALKRGGVAGTKNFVVIADGFGSSADRGSKAYELKHVAERLELTVVGPNCLGYMNFVSSTYPCIQDVDDFTPHAAKQGVAVVSQSGGLMLALLSGYARRNLELSYAVSTGSEAVLGVEDLLEWLPAQGGVGAVGLIVEGFRSGRRFLRAANALLADGVPLVLLPLGRSERGKVSTVAHTGKLAEDHRTLGNVCAQYGIEVVRDLTEMGEMLTAMNGCRSARPRAPRLGAAMISGGAAALVADACESSGLELSELGTKTAGELRSSLPSGAHVGNPLDMSGGSVVNDPAKIVSALNAIERSPSIECSAFVFPARASGGSRGARKVLGKLFESTPSRSGGAPRFVVSPNGDGFSDYWYTKVAESGAIALQDMYPAMKAIGAACRTVSAQDRAAERLRSRQLPSPADRHDTGRRTEVIKHANVMAMLRANRIPMVGEALLSERASRDELGSAAASLGFPVVLKAVAATIPHKKDVGAVALGINDVEALCAAADDMKTRASIGQWGTYDLVIQRQVPVGSEYIMGVVHSERFGPLIAFGPGGTVVELIREATVLLVPPVMPIDVDRLYSYGALGELLRGYRGEKGVAKDTLVALFEGVSAVLSANERLCSLEINPLAVDSGSGDLVGLDVLAEGTADVVDGAVMVLND